VISETPERAWRGPLFRWRTDLRLSQAEAAAQLKLETVQYARYERAENLPRRELLREIEKRIGIEGMAAAIVLYFHDFRPGECALYERMCQPYTGQS